MGKKGSSKKAPNAIAGPQMSVTIREASTGKKQTNAKSSLKLQHIKNLAMWASRDAAIPSLGAFFGYHFAASSEALGTPVDPSLFTCQRCESILHPGYNCTIRIEKDKTNARHRGKKARVHPRNNIVYTCHFCSHRNVKRGTPRDISAPKAKPHPKPTPMTSRVHESASSTKAKTGNIVSSSDMTEDNRVTNTLAAPLGALAHDPRGEMGVVEISETLKAKDDPAASSPVTPLARTTLTLLEAKKRKRNRSGAKKTAASETETNPAAVNAKKTANTSTRRRRKSWTSLKEIAESSNNDNSKRFINLTVPFSMQ